MKKYRLVRVGFCGVVAFFGLLIGSMAHAQQVVNGGSPKTETKVTSKPSKANEAAKEQRIAELKVQIGRAVDNKDWPKAVELTEELIQVAPTDASGYRQMTFLKVQLKQYDAAVDHAMRAVSLDSGNPRSQGNLCSVLLDVKKYQQAREACNEGLKIDPLNWLITFNKANAYLLQGDRKQAMDWYAQALGLINSTDEFNRSIRIFDKYIEMQLQVDLFKQTRAEFEVMWNGWRAVLDRSAPLKEKAKQALAAQNYDLLLSTKLDLFKVLSSGLKPGHPLRCSLVEDIYVNTISAALLEVKKPNIDLLHTLVAFFESQSSLDYCHADHIDRNHNLALLHYTVAERYMKTDLQKAIVSAELALQFLDKSSKTKPRDLRAALDLLERLYARAGQTDKMNQTAERRKKT
jgi:tetratricopeptide (TPR) repeat protein